ncbi:23S rRNA (pseudouridine(1915)-N(3))-methyltransferase RlmH [Eubacterium minutum ATCC 700079]|nr:23S rRNA (pseudouridine(1915)-N(3))-methyltransferase RlmH [Eubacterium minutum ATCC 700079]
MNISIICIGKLKERYWQEAVSEYSKRLKNYCKLKIVELKETKLSLNAGTAETEAVRISEGKEILSRLGENTFVIALEIKGERMDSEKFAKKIERLGNDGKSDISFVIGGSLGLSREVSARADYRLSFSDMTFPHQMMRVILLEQIYRCFKINKNEPYHK